MAKPSSIARQLRLLLVAGAFPALLLMAAAQEPPAASTRAPASPDRAASTRAFLGLGAVPDKAAATRAEPIYQQNCLFCHGAKARGATAPSLITSETVLADDHGEKLAAFLKSGRPEKGMPAFAQLSDQQRTDLAEYLHQQIEDVANRGAYQLPNILVGDAAKGKQYAASHCMSCHSESTFAHIASSFRSPDQLQRGWIWPARTHSSSTTQQSLAVMATVKTPQGQALSGRVTQVSDFRITLITADGQQHTLELAPETTIQWNDPLAPHEALIQTLKNDDMHNVTAYLETLK